MTERGWLRGLVCCAVAVLAPAFAADREPPPLVLYTQAELAETPSPVGKTLPELLRLGNMQRPAPDAVWRPVQLPDLRARKTGDTSEDARTQSRMRWYRLQYDRPGASTDANDPPLGLYIPLVVSGPLSILMRDGGQWWVVYQSNERWREEWNRPVLVELPHDAGQHVEIVIGCSGGGGRARPARDLDGLDGPAGRRAPGSGGPRTPRCRG
jgi:hypothetical protein